MLTRPPSSPRMAILKPSPSAPMRLATGTRQSSNITMAVGCECQPIFFSGAAEARPGVPFSTRKHEMPRGPALAGPRHDQIDVGGAGAGNEGLGCRRARSGRALGARAWSQGRRIGAGSGSVRQ